MQRNRMRISGLYTALATPVTSDGRVDLEGLDRLCDFVIERGTSGICLGGATSEYPRFEVTDRVAILQRVAHRLPQTPLLVAIGASSVERTLDLGRAAFDRGCRAVLLPMPWFFPYDQDDLAAYVARVAHELPGPCLLYDLPEFTSGLAADTVIDLLAAGDQVAGIKDSSGRVENLERFAAARGTRDWSLLAGDDRCGLAAAQSGWDGAVSGLACCCPELLAALHDSIAREEVERSRRLQALVDELAAHVAPLPTPWGVRVALGARGCDIGPLPLPLSPRRAEQVTALEAWLPGWLAAIPGVQR
jgi:4-hydroxy-tetrahydrodipicolinate synthase